MRMLTVCLAGMLLLAPALTHANPIVVVHPAPPPKPVHHFHGHHHHNGFWKGPGVVGAMIGCAAILPILDTAIKQRRLSYREGDADVFSCLIPIPFVGYMIGDWIGQQNERALAAQR